MRHDVLCPNPAWCDDNGGMACNLIESGRVDGLTMALEALQKAFPKVDIAAEIQQLLNDDLPLVEARPAVHAAFCWCDGCQGQIPHPEAVDA